MLTIEEIKKAVSELIEPLFKQQTVKVEKATNEVERKALFVVLEPEVVDEHGDIYSAKEVEKAMLNFNKHSMKANLFHMVETQDAEIQQSYTAPADMYVGEKLVQKGTWLQSWYFPETEIGEKLWQGVVSGEFNGVSINAMAATEEL